MIERMSKLGFVVAFVVSGAIFSSCSQRLGRPKNEIYDDTSSVEMNKVYGSYLAGRVAHLRKDFDKAADYYMNVLQKDTHNVDLMNNVYLLLVSKGRVHEAAKYAKMAKQNGDNNNLIDIILMTDNMKEGKYEKAEQNLHYLKGDIYDQFIVPLLSSWTYVGRDKNKEIARKKALSHLEPLKKGKNFRALYHFHAGMINDFYGQNKEAQKNYEVIVNEESLEMSFRALQVISNFYLRSGQKEKAVALVAKYGNDKLLNDMLKRLLNNVKTANKTIPPLIENGNFGLSEGLFSIASTLRQGVTGVDLAHMFVNLAIYVNPKNDVAKLLLADVWESREMYPEAIEVYDQILKSSEAYYTVQIKKAGDYVLMEDYKSAELLLKALELDGYHNYQSFLDLGDVLRVSQKYGEAIEYYKKALSQVEKVTNEHWVLFYAMGIAYEQDKQWQEAEKYFLKAMDLSQNHYLVLNYLGYVWLKQGEKVEQAFGMIVDAYNQAPNDGNILDSLGWAFYRLGKYDEAIGYMEKAAELEPANAVICDHLGDAYWMGNRKNEAYFQWNHTLSMTDDTRELDYEFVRAKINGQQPKNKIPDYNVSLIEEKIKEIIKE